MSRKGGMKRVDCAESASSTGRPQRCSVAGGSIAAPPACPGGFSYTQGSLQSLHLAETFLCLCINKGQVSSQWQELSLMEETSCVERYSGQRVRVPPHLSALGPHEPSQAGCSRWKKTVQKAGDKFDLKMIVFVKQTTVQKKT